MLAASMRGSAAGSKFKESCMKRMKFWIPKLPLVLLGAR